jgi:ABC-type nitrate/sulfonate/bicarbonate transport system ATPase subunit/GNAT superfamily N-acetyltransferase
MPLTSTRNDWALCVNAEIRRAIPATPAAGRVAAMFGLDEGEVDTLYDALRFELRSGQIAAVVGPSGAGKTVLLRKVAQQVPRARWLRAERLAGVRQAAVDILRGGELPERLRTLSRCGLAEAPALVTPAACLSGGQRYRLALAEVLHAALAARRAVLVLADEFGACLDEVTAVTLCRRVRRLVTGSPVALLLATSRGELVQALEPEITIVKPLRGRPEVLTGPRRGRTGAGRLTPRRWPIVRGTIRDYHALGGFHYLAGRPAVHKRVWVIRPPRSLLARRRHAAGLPDPAAVLVVSRPLLSVRGRNLATAGRYAGPDRAAAAELLNREIECISRVVVHPVFRGCGLAVRLVRHALATAETPLTEALAAMGRIHPFFARAGMEAYSLPPDRHVARLVSAAESIGLSRQDLVAVRPVRRLLRRRCREAAFLRRELRQCIAGTHRCRRTPPPADPVADVCRRTARQYVYYLADTTKE